MRHVILVTGTRRALTGDGITTVLDVLNSRVDMTNHPPLFVHGDCPTGVDAIVEAAYADTLPFPAKWDVHGKAAGPIRNGAMVTTVQAMAAYGIPVTVVGFPASDSRGTRNCIDQARAAWLDVLVRPLPDIYLMPLLQPGEGP